MPPTPAHTTSGGSPFFVRWLPRVLTILALLMLLQLITPEGSWLFRALEFFWMWVVPVTPIDFVSSVILILLAAALSFRKRLAWWILLALLVVIIALIGLVIVVAYLVSPDILGWDLATSLVLPIAGIIGLLVYRRWYIAKTQPRGFLKAIAVLIAGLVLTVIIVLTAQYIIGGLTMIEARDILAELFGFKENTESSWMLTVFGFGSGLSIILAFWTLLRSSRDSERIDIDQERQIRVGLANHASDSLGYFSTRRDRSAFFAEDCVLTYRVQAGVCLVASDPIGPPSQWPAAARQFVAFAESYGWVPAVLAASKQGAQAYHDAGLKVLHVGDEAVLLTKDFTLSALPEVQRAVAKLTGLGYTIRIRRQGDIDAEDLERLGRFADEWRDGDTERGFSMALGRFGDPADADGLVVEALFPADAGTLAEQTAGLLCFVPWGETGASLDLMRRHPFAENGVTEFMVAGLMREAPDVGIAAVSLNFAVFRSAFEQGKELGAGPMKRLWRNVLLFASRFWQLESLYRSNEKYHPEWVPRMLCYPEGSDLARIGLAVSIAEGFLNPPRIFAKGSHDQPIYTPAEAAPLLGITRTTAPAEPALRVSDQVRHRLGVREAMLESGVEPYPAQAAPAAAKGTVLAGRVLGIRDHGGVVFLDVRSQGSDTQLVCEREVLGEESMRQLRSWVSRGDRISVTGREGTSRTGTPSFLVTSWTMSAKSLQPWPSLHQGLTDPEAKVRQRYLDFTMNTGQRDLMVIRSNTFRTIRETLQSRGFLEVETPILQTVHGGANARPFLTHINAYNLDLYLRIAPELYLKRLLVGAFDRVFEMGRNFRNEGVDATHNPEFSMLEAYQAGGDYNTMRELTRTMVINAAEAALGTTVVRGTVDGVEHEIDLADEWRTVSLTDIVSEKIGDEVTTATSVEELRAIATRVGMTVNPKWGWGMLLQEIYEEVAEESTVAPTFYTDFPAETSPLTRQHREDPMLAEKWDLIIFGSELGTAYSELVDPVLQRERLTAQSLAAAGGDPEAMQLDEDFLRALEYGMPPAGGMGMGLDRLVMLLTEQTIRSTITFPLAKPKGH
ncbi:bifunctional lysylphosphatidylglycerol synthetase/lysine--tRNA ligase LysX [Brevibacterium casei]